MEIRNQVHASVKNANHANYVIKNIMSIIGIQK